MGNQRKMRGDSEDVTMPKCAATAADAEESFLPPIDSRWSATSDEHDDLGYAESTEGGNQGAASVQSRRQCDKKIAKSGRFLVNKSSMSDSFVLPNIANMALPEGFRKSRTAGSNWSHGAHEGMPMSKSCPILKNRNGYQWGKDSSEEDNDDEDFERDFLSMSYNVMMQSERDENNRNDVEKNRLAKIETNSRTVKGPSKGANTNSSSLGETKLPDIFSHHHDRSVRGLRDDNNNGAAAERRRVRKENIERRSKADVVKSGQKMEYELDVSPWRGDPNQANENPKEDAMVVDGEDGGNHETSNLKSKRKAGSHKLPIKSKNPESKCIEWLQESHH